MPTDILLPHIVYKNVPEAIAWLTRVFGFREHYRYGEPNGAQLYLGKAYIMVRGTSQGEVTPAQMGGGTQSLTVFVEEVDTHYRHAQSEGARIVEDLHETEYGERQYGVVDLDGHHWLFSQHVKDVSPDEWGAMIARPRTMVRSSIFGCLF